MPKRWWKRQLDGYFKINVMKRIYLLLIFGFIFSTGKIIAQEQEKAVDNPSVQSFLALSETIQSGEIHFVVNEQWKGKSTLKTEEYKIIFNKTGAINKYHEVEFNYNILSVKDSIQYVYNGMTWCIIDHKKKTNEMFSFYARQNLRGSFLNVEAITNIQRTDNSIFLETESNYYFSFNSKKDKKVLYAYTKEYEWDADKSILFRYNRTLKDGITYPRRTVLKQETLLTDAFLNEGKYTDSQLYNGLNYAQSYKVKYLKIKKQ